MVEFCPRSITFNIPGKLGVAVQVTVVENNGNSDFTAEVLGTANFTVPICADCSFNSPRLT